MKLSEQIESEVEKRELGNDPDLRGVAEELERRYPAQPWVAVADQHEETAPGHVYSRADLLALHSELTSKARALMVRKNSDYSTVGPFQNLRASEAFGISAELGTLVRLGDKLSRIRTLMEREGQVTDESFEDTIIDGINYLILIAGLRREKQLLKESK